jgi:D-3-phosphoglycerate dehydrogenase
MSQGIDTIDTTSCRVAVLDDWQDAARASADWSRLGARATLEFFGAPFAGEDEAADRLAPFDIILAMRERTPFPASLIRRLPRLRMFGLTGSRAALVDMAFMRDRGITVCLTDSGPGAESTAELALALMLAAARDIPAASAAARSGAFQRGTKPGMLLDGKTLGVIGLGKIGSLVADAAIRLGMNVQGYDPHITVEAAWSLPSQVKRAASVDELIKTSHFVTLHVPLGDKTRHLINSKNIEQFRHGAVLLNFSREGIVAEDAVAKGLKSHALKWYVTDFPSGPLLGHPGVIALPHLGASTREAEDNCAIMVVDQVRDYLEQGNLQNAVNFPDAAMPREAPFRLAIANANVPDMLGRISHALGRRKINIHNMLNKSRGEMAYTLVDADSPVPNEVIKDLADLNGVLSVRYLPVDG